jgi:thiosulfate reductase cytochrome b subunit
MPILDPVPRRVRTAEVARPVVYRHGLPTRIWHWLNAAVILIMLMSGLMIFNAHPRLYWGQYGANPDYSWLQIGNLGDQGFLQVGNHTIHTTGFLGVSGGPGDQTVYTAFPGWLTIPSSYDLAGARHWHLTFAWLFVAAILAYWIFSLGNRHIWRDIVPSRHELAPRHIFDDIKNHALLRFPRGEAARRYNTLQKLSYLGVVFVLIPLQILTGLTMSPAMDAPWPWLVDVFGGRQSARSIHFICAMLLVLFFLVHILMVVLVGPINEVRSMITGRYRLPAERR